MLDRTSALAALGGNEQLLKELAQIFIEDAPVLLNEIDAAIDNNNVAEARRAVHSLRGLTSTFYAEKASDLARRIEESLSDGCMQKLEDGWAQELRTTVHELIGELNGL